MTETLVWRVGTRAVELDVVRAGSGPTVLLLPALSSIATVGELAPLQARLAERFATVAVDWPGFGVRPRPPLPLTPVLLRAFLDHVLDAVAPRPWATVAAGHGAGYLVGAAADRPGRAGRLALVAPTWRGPLPTVLGRRSALGKRLVRAGDLPVVGQALYRLNVNPAMLRVMAREHVYADPAWLRGDRLAAKAAVTGARGARHGALRFVTGELDPAADRDGFLAAAARVADPVLVVYGEGTPRRSRAEMDALAALPGVRAAVLPRGRLALHEEFPDAVAEAVLPFLEEVSPAGRAGTAR